jgi:hypothetical protein
MHTYDGVLPGVTKGYLLSPPQCHAAFGTMPHTLASVDRSHVCCPRMLPPSATRTSRVGFWRGGGRNTLKEAKHNQSTYMWIIVQVGVGILCFQ